MKNSPEHRDGDKAAVESEPRKSGRFELLNKWVREQAVPAILAVGAVFGMARVAEAGPRTEEGVPTHTEAKHLQMPGAHFTFFYTDQDGQEHFNPWAMIAPVQGELSRRVVDTRQQTFTIPYEYARGFDSAKNVDPHAHERIVAYVDQEIKTQLADVLYGFDRNKDVYRTHHEASGVKNIKVESIAVTGFASPEGPAGEGPGTLARGAVDLKNLELGELRGRDAAQATQESFAKMGIQVPDEKAFADVRAEELQFSEPEMSTLAELANGEEGVDDLEKIFNLVKKYNAGEIAEGETKQKLDTIIDAKRGIRVTITYTGEHQEVLILPAPIFLLLLTPLLFPRRREENPEQAKEPIREPELPPEIPEKVRETPLPPPESPGYQDMEEATYIDDLHVFFDHPGTIGRGLSYRRMVGDIARSYDNFTDNTTREDHWTASVLRGWQEHDRHAREEAGISGADLTKGLDYENQESQIRWARMHARALIDLARVSRAKHTSSEDERYDAITRSLEWRTTALLGRRISRQEGAQNNPAVY
jgi:hypothetical protein